MKIDKIQRINKIILNRKKEIRNGIDTIKKIEIKIVLEKKRKKMMSVIYDKIEKDNILTKINIILNKNKKDKKYFE